MMGLFQGDSNGNGEWEAPLSANVVGVASVACPPPLEGVEASSGTFSAPRGSQAGGFRLPPLLCH